MAAATTQACLPSSASSSHWAEISLIVADHGYELRGFKLNSP
jgi:hypothetical protein